MDLVQTYAVHLRLNAVRVWLFRRNIALNRRTRHCVTKAAAQHSNAPVGADDLKPSLPRFFHSYSASSDDTASAYYVTTPDHCTPQESCHPVAAPV